MIWPRKSTTDNVKKSSASMLWKTILPVIFLPTKLKQWAVGSSVLKKDKKNEASNLTPSLL